MVGIPGSRDLGEGHLGFFRRIDVSQDFVEKFISLIQVRIITQNYSGKKALSSVKRTELLVPGKMEHNPFSLFLPFSSVQSFSRVQFFAIPRITAHQASLSITNSRSLLKRMSIKLLMPFSHLILCRPFLFLPTIRSSIRVFSNVSTLHMRWPKYWSFSFSISPSKNTQD